MGDKYILAFLFCLILLPLSNAELQVGLGDEDNGIGINFDPVVIPFDNNTGSVNYSTFSGLADCWSTAEGVKCDVADITYDEISGGDVNALGYTGTFNFLAGVVGQLSMDGNPWYLGGTDIQFSQEIQVDGDSNLNNTYPQDTLSSSLGSGALRWLWLYVANISAEHIDTFTITAENMTVDLINGINISNLSNEFAPISEPLSLHLNQDNWNNDSFGWIYWDAATPKIVFNQSKLETKFFNATALEVVTGTGAGNLADIQSYNNIPYNVTEDTSDVDLRVNFSVGVGGEFNQLIIRYRSAEEDLAHRMIVQIYEPDELEWEEYGILPGTSIYHIVEFGVYDSDEHVDSNGIVQVRFFQDEGVPPKTHMHNFDWVAISKGFGTPAGEEVDPVFNEWLESPKFMSNLSMPSYNITADTYFGDGSELTGIVGDNSSWNESMAYGLFLNRTSESDYLSTYNETYDAYVDTDTWLSNYTDYYNKSQVDNNFSLITHSVNGTNINVLDINASGLTVTQSDGSGIKLASNLLFGALQVAELQGIGAVLPWFTIKDTLYIRTESTAAQLFFSNADAFTNAVILYRVATDGFEFGGASYYAFSNNVNISGHLNVTGGINVDENITADWVKAKVNYSDVQNHPANGYGNGDDANFTSLNISDVTITNYITNILSDESIVGCGLNQQMGDLKWSNNSVETTCWKVANGTGGTTDLRQQQLLSASALFSQGDSGGSYQSLGTHFHLSTNYYGSGVQNYGSGQYNAGGIYGYGTTVMVSGPTASANSAPYYTQYLKQCMCNGLI